MYTLLDVFVRANIRIAMFPSPHGQITGNIPTLTGKITPDSKE
jgi:hypothetical protein